MADRIYYNKAEKSWNAYVTINNKEKVFITSYTVPILTKNLKWFIKILKYLMEKLKAIKT